MGFHQRSGYGGQAKRKWKNNQVETGRGGLSPQCCILYQGEPSQPLHCHTSGKGTDPMANSWAAAALVNYSHFPQGVLLGLCTICSLIYKAGRLAIKYSYYPMFISVPTS